MSTILIQYTNFKERKQNYKFSENLKYLRVIILDFFSFISIIINKLIFVLKYNSLIKSSEN